MQATTYSNYAVRKCFALSLRTPKRQLIFKPGHLHILGVKGFAMDLLPTRSRRLERRDLYNPK